MLLNENKFDKTDSKYQCDMCKTQISSLKRITINMAEGYANPRKKWDLCKKCYMIIEKNVNNWLRRKQKI